MRIAMLAASVGSPFGQERVLEESIRMLKGAGHSVAVITDRRTGAMPRIDYECVVPGLATLHSYSNPLTAYFKTRRAMRALREFEPNIVHWIDQLDYRLIRSVAARYPMVMTAHTVSPTCPASTRAIVSEPVCRKISGWSCVQHSKEERCLSFLKSDLRRYHAVQNYLLRKRLLQKHVKYVFSISDFLTRTLIADGWPKAKIVAVPNPVRRFTMGNLAEAESTLSASRPLIVAASRLTPLKGMDVLLEALALISKDIPWNLTVCGDGPLRLQLSHHAATLKLADRIQWMGATSWETTQKLMSKAAVFVQTNTGPEGFGMAVVEAMTLAVPVIATDIPALNEILQNGKTGILVPWKDPQSLARALAKLLTEPTLRAQLGKQAKQSVERGYTPEKHLEATEKYYRQAAGISEKRSAKARAG